jgi:hypothetical protein
MSRIPLPLIFATWSASGSGTWKYGRWGQYNAGGGGGYPTALDIRA